MVESPKYERLKAVIGLTARPLASEDYEEDGRAGTARTEVGDAKGTSEDFVVDLSVGESQTKTGADSWLSSFIESAKTHQGKITTAKAHHLAVRESMSTAVTDGEQLSPVLLSESDVAASQQNPPLRLTSADGKTVEYTEPTAYLTALEQQKNDKREAEAQTILDKLNQEADSHVSEFQHQKDDYVPDAWKPRVEGDAGSAPSPSPAYSGGSRGLVTTVRSGTGTGGGEWTSPAPGELGSASNPISDPADLARYDLTTTPVNQRMTPNGPVGGHMPADVLNVNDPAWRAVPSVAGGGARIAGGVLVAGSAAGAAGAALSYGGGFAGIGGLASGASGSALRAVAPAGGVLRPSALPGGGVAGAVGGAGRGGGAGVVGRGGVAPVGSGASGTAGGRGASAGGRGASGGVAGRGGVSAAGRGASGAGAVGRGGVAPVGSGAAGSAGGRGGVGGGRATSGVTAVGRGASGGGRGASGGVAGRGGVAPVGSGGVGDRREKKGQVRRRAYDVVRVDALEERGAQMMGGAAGSADQLKPIARDADADW